MQYSLRVSPVNTPTISQAGVFAGARIPFFKDGLSQGNITTTGNWSEVSGLTNPTLSANSNFLWAQSDGSIDFLLAMGLDGSDQGELTLQGVSGVDHEDLSSARVGGVSRIYLFDFGNNGNGADSRGAGIDLVVYRIIEPTITGSDFTITSGNIEKIDCAFPGGDVPTHRDCEVGMIDTNGDIYIITKREAIPTVYFLAHASSYTGTQTLTSLGNMFDIPDSSSVAASGNAVGGNISPDGTEILIKSYNIMYHFPRSDSQTVIQALSANPTELASYVGGGNDNYPKSSPSQEPQGEAATFGFDGNNYFTTSELQSDHGGGDGVPLFKYERINKVPTTISFQDGVAPTGAYAGTEDTYTESSVGAAVHGTDITFISDVGPGERVGFLKFDISAIPAGSTIVGAKVDLFIDTEGQGWTFHRVLNSDWDEADSFNSLPNGPPASDDVFASSTEDNRNGVNLDTLTLTVRNNVLIATVQAWLDGTQSNFGWIIRGTHATDGQQFDSRENATTANNPALTVRFI